MPRYTDTPFYRSLLSGTPCRHRHGSYIEARDCGYKREKKECEWGSSVVDDVGAPVSPERGLPADEAAHDAAREARQAARREETGRLRQEILEAAKKRWWDPNRPR